MESGIFSGSLSSASSEEDARDEFVPMDDVVALNEGTPAHEQAFDSLSSFRSELFDRPHLPNEEDTSIITTMVANLNEGVMTRTTHPPSPADTCKQRHCILRMIFVIPLRSICLDQESGPKISTHQ